MGLKEYITLFAVLLLLVGMRFFRHTLFDALMEAFNNFRGGPRPPTHPLPANDAVLLLRRRPMKPKAWRL
jgi:hypothetical protein